MNIYYLKYFFMEAVKNIIRNKGLSIISVIIFSITLFTFSSFLFVSKNLKQVLINLEGMADISIYLKESVKEIERDDLIVNLRSHQGIKEVRFISKEDALKYFEEDDDIKIMLEVLGENPLPESIDLVLTNKFRDKEHINKICDHISEYKMVEDIYSRSKITEMISFVKSIGLTVFLVFLVISVLIIANTIRLTVYSKKQEIEIRRLVGATELFVRLPFIIDGCIKGIISVFLCTIFMFLLKLLIVSGLTVPGGQEIIFLSFFDFIIMILIGISLGGISSFLAVKRFFH